MRSTNKQPITTHLSVNNSQSEYCTVRCKVPPIGRQGQILTLFQIYWCGKINQLSRVTRGFLTSYLFSFSRLFDLLENLGHQGYICKQSHIQKNQFVSALNNCDMSLLISHFSLLNSLFLCAGPCC